MNVTFNPDLQKFIEKKVRAGQYASLEQAVNEMLSRLRRQEELTPEDIAELQAEADVGLAEADRGEFVEFSAEDVIADRRAARAAQKKGK